MDPREPHADACRQRQRRAERSRLAVETVSVHARAHGLAVEEPVVLNDLFSLMVHLRPSPVVARIATCMPRLRIPIEEWLGREIDVTSYLVRQGAPVVGPSAELPPGPHTVDGLTFSYWTYVQPVPDRTPTAADCAAMLVDLHVALRWYPGKLPLVGSGDISRGLELLDRAGGILDEADLALLHATAERLHGFMASPADDWQPLHGDAHPGNVIATRTGLLWIDFEDVCRGPIEWDLASIMDAGAASLHHRPDPDVLAHCRKLRALQIALCLTVYHDEFGDLDGWDDGIRSMLATLASPC